MRHGIRTGSKTCSLFSLPIVSLAGALLGFWPGPAMGAFVEVDIPTPEFANEFKTTLDDRIQKTIDAWYQGKKCDFTSQDAPSSTPGSCSRFIPGQKVGRICNPLAAPPELLTNRLGQSCGSSCDGTFQCRKTFTYVDPSTGATLETSSDLNNSPSEGCKLCQLDYAPLNRDQWNAFAAENTPAKLARGTLSGTGCGCCTISVNYSSCERESSYLRGLLVETVKRLLARVKSKVVSGTPLILPIPGGPISRCFAMALKIQGVGAKFHSENGDPGNDSCSLPPGDDGFLSLLSRNGMVQAACYREAAMGFIRYTSGFLAACRILETAEEAYVTAVPKVKALVETLDCSSQPSVSQCVDQLDQELIQLLKLHVQKAVDQSDVVGEPPR